MPRYVILSHDHPFPHWDFMLEHGDALATWRLLDAPAPGRTCRAESLPNHRAAYLDYEGPVSGGRGVVARWDHGTYGSVEPGRLDSVRLHGVRDLAFAEMASGIEEVSWTFGGFERAAANLTNATSSESAESPPGP